MEMCHGLDAVASGAVPIVDAQPSTTIRRAVLDSSVLVSGTLVTSRRWITAMVIGLSIILIITSLVMILLVLLHKGKGGGLSDLFGGGVSSTLGSSSVVERNLDRITIFFGVLWFVVIIALGFLVNH